jgi:hypothetical protein
MIRTHQYSLTNRDRALDVASIHKSDQAGTMPMLGHSGNIVGLAATGNPESVQDQSRHKEARMPMRYLKPFSVQESAKILQGVDFQR